MTFSTGSSPRMRGKRLIQAVEAVRIRLIPAHAGKTRRFIRDSGMYAAHPRACGENRQVRASRYVALGSSPRMRGKRARLVRSRRARGLIPAHAGKTPRGRGAVVHEWAHPRACGENLSTDTEDVILAGSSPRMRGKRGPASPGTQERWLIPAHAGKTLNDLEF